MSSNNHPATDRICWFGQGRLALFDFWYFLMFATSGIRVCHIVKINPENIFHHSQFVMPQKMMSKCKGNMGEAGKLIIRCNMQLIAVTYHLSLWCSNSLNDSHQNVKLRICVEMGQMTTPEIDNYYAFALYYRCLYYSRSLTQLLDLRYITRESIKRDCQHKRQWTSDLSLRSQY